MSDMAQRRNPFAWALLKVLRRRTTAVIVGLVVAGLLVEPTVMTKTIMASVLVMVFAAVWPFELKEIKGGDTRPSRHEMLLSTGAALAGGYFIHQLFGAAIEQLIAGLAVGAVVGYWALGDYKSLLAE